MGAFDDHTRFQASKNGYTIGLAQLEPFCERCNPHRWVHFALEVPAAPAVVAGTYSVSFEVNPTCGGFPTELRRRTHQATIAPNSKGYFEVPVSGGAFGAYPYLSGGISGNHLAFWLEGFSEQLSPNSYLIYSFAPSATIESSPQVINAVGGGTITYCELLTPTGPVNDCWHQVVSINNVCQRENHRLTFTRK